MVIYSQSVYAAYHFVRKALMLNRIEIIKIRYVIALFIIAWKSSNLTLHSVRLNAQRAVSLV